MPTTFPLAHPDLKTQRNLCTIKKLRVWNFEITTKLNQNLKLFTELWPYHSLKSVKLGCSAEVILVKVL